MIKNNFSEAVTNSNFPLILDGAVGGLLQQKGFKTDKNLWTTNVNLENPDSLSKIHEDYIKSGCDIITSNTFRTNPVAINRSNITENIEDIVRRSVMISRKMADKHNIFLAGSNPPAEDCYQIERRVSESQLIDNHQKHIDLLFGNGVDVILNETQSHFDEIKIICNHCFRNEIPYCISLFVTKELKLLSGEPIIEIVDYVKSFNPIAILFNCITPIQFSKLLEFLDINYEWGFYLNCGGRDIIDNNIECGIDAISYSQIVKSSLHLNPKIIGSCCGSNPDHTKEIKNLLDETIKS